MTQGKREIIQDDTATKESLLILNKRFLINLYYVSRIRNQPIFQPLGLIINYGVMYIAGFLELH